MTNKYDKLHSMLTRNNQHCEHTNDLSCLSTRFFLEISDCAMKLQEFKRLKQTGNKWLRAKNYSRAMHRYDLAVGMVDPKASGSSNAWRKATSVQRDEGRDYHLVGLLNRAQCQLCLERYKECVADCNRALLIDEKCVKALFRKASALVGMEQLEQAKEVLTLAKQLEPRNAEVNKKLLKVRAHVRHQAAKTKKALGGLSL